MQHAHAQVKKKQQQAEAVDQKTVKCYQYHFFEHNRAVLNLLLNINNVLKILLHFISDGESSSKFNFGMQMTVYVY